MGRLRLRHGKRVPNHILHVLGIVGRSLWQTWQDIFVECGEILGLKRHGRVGIEQRRVAHQPVACGRPPCVFACLVVGHLPRLEQDLRFRERCCAVLVQINAGERVKAEQIVEALAADHLGLPNGLQSVEAFAVVSSQSIEGGLGDGRRAHTWANETRRLFARDRLRQWRQRCRRRAFGRHTIKIAPVDLEALHDQHQRIRTHVIRAEVAPGDRRGLVGRALRGFDQQRSRASQHATVSKGDLQLRLVGHVHQFDGLCTPTAVGLFGACNKAFVVVLDPEKCGGSLLGGEITYPGFAGGGLAGRGSGQAGCLQQPQRKCGRHQGVA